MFAGTSNDLNAIRLLPLYQSSESYRNTSPDNSPIIDRVIDRFRIQKCYRSHLLITYDSVTLELLNVEIGVHVFFSSVAAYCFMPRMGDVWVNALAIRFRASKVADA